MRPGCSRSFLLALASLAVLGLTGHTGGQGLWERYGEVLQIAQEIEHDPELRKQRVLDAFLRQVALRAAVGPLLIVFEDLHWADPSTLELVDRLVDVVQNLPILLILTFRPEFSAPWAGQSHVTYIMLNRLDAPEIHALISATVGGKELPGNVVDQIMERTDGIPLFVEELSRSVVESGLLKIRGDQYVLTGELRLQAIPATLQDSLAARLDRMSNIRETAQLGAAIGRRFSCGA